MISAKESVPMISVFSIQESSDSRNNEEMSKVRKGKKKVSAQQQSANPSIEDTDEKFAK